jgi:adenylate kinase
MDSTYPQSPVDLILFGRQGSGKGTQGKFLAERYGLIPFVTGDELRKLSQDPSPLGQKVKSIVEAGHLVPNEVVMEIIEHFMQQLPEGKRVLFDGIPRKRDQAESFDALMKKLGRDFKGVVFEISEAEAIRRLTNRRMCEQCKTIYSPDFKGEQCSECGGKLVIRSDDTNRESIQNRLHAYATETLPVIEQYEHEGKVSRINGEQSIEKVNEQTYSLLDPTFL